MNTYKKFPLLEEALQPILARKSIYQKLRIPLPVFMIETSNTKVKEDIMDYLLQVCKENNLREFNSYTELEIHTLKDTKNGISDVFDHIYDNSVYTNEFEGLVAIDISCLQNMLKDDRCSFFFEETAELAKTSTIVLFNCDVNNRNKIRLNEKVSQNFANLKIISLDCSETLDYVQSLFTTLNSYNIMYDKSDLIEVLTQLVTISKIETEDDLQILQEKVLLCADASSREVKLNSNMLNVLFEEVQ